MLVLFSKTCSPAFKLAKKLQSFQLHIVQATETFGWTRYILNPSVYCQIIIRGTRWINAKNLAEAQQNLKLNQRKNKFCMDVNRFTS